jgi:hypothetical protein
MLPKNTNLCFPANRHYRRSTLPERSMKYAYPPNDKVPLTLKPICFGNTYRKLRIKAEINSEICLIRNQH